MDAKYFIEGYTLMIQYLRENRILTKERNFRNRLERFYEMNKDKEVLDLKEEREYLQLEKYFYNNVIEPRTTEEHALTNYLNIVANVKYD